MYFQGRRKTCNMLRSLKQKQRKEWTSSHKIYQAKCFVGVRYQNVMERYMHRIKVIHVDVPVLTTCLSSYFFGCPLLLYLCNTNCLEPVQDQWIPKALFSYFSMKMFAVGYSLEASLSNVNGNFTLSRLIKRPNMWVLAI